MSFFHQKATHREQHNRVQRLKDAAGNYFDDNDEITKCFTSYFDNLFSSNLAGEVGPVLVLVAPMVGDEMVAMLDAPFRREEVTLALSQMHPNKALGPDGMNALFYQTFWSIIREDVIDKIMSFLNNMEDIGNVNKTHIVLILKKQHCESPVDFRPISLCNVIYKLSQKSLRIE